MVARNKDDHRAGRFIYFGTNAGLVNMFGNTFDMHAFHWRTHLALNDDFENHIRTHDQATGKRNDFHRPRLDKPLDNTFAFNLRCDSLFQGILDRIANMRYINRERTRNQKLTIEIFLRLCFLYNQCVFFIAGLGLV